MSETNDGKTPCFLVLSAWLTSRDDIDTAAGGAPGGRGS